MDKDGLRFGAGNGTVQWLFPALLSYTQAQKLFKAALPGAALAAQPASREGAFTITVAGQVWRLVPQVLLPAGAVGQAPTPAADWWMGGNGVLYLRLSSRAQGVRVVD